MAELGMPIFNNIRNTNFFNGRLLTATDLSDEQTANRRQHEQLGQAIGAGIAYGLTVELLDPSGDQQRVSVEAGLGVNTKGQAVSLATKIELVLTPTPDPVATRAGLFVDCPDVVTDSLAAPTGITLLVMAPTSGYAERTPMRSFDDGSVSGCGDRYAVEGVQFRLVEVDASAMAGVAQLVAIPNIGGNTTALSKLRNLLAHFCFGTPELSTYREEPFLRADGQSVYATHGALDALFGVGKLTDCDVPLALLYRNGGTFHFVDNWSVRRRIIAPSVDTLWPLHIGTRRPAEDDAVFLQFQDQVTWLGSRGAVAAVEARTYFRYLPPVGYLPTGVTEFTVNHFFNGLNYQLVESDPAFLRLRVGQALWLDPLDLDPSNPRNAETPILVYADADRPGYVIFVRGERTIALPTPEPPTDAPPTDEPPPVVVPPGRVTVDLVVSKAGSTAVDLDQRTDIQIWAEDLDKPRKRFPASLVKRGVTKISQGNRIPLQDAAVRYEIRDLPPGNYQIYVQVTGFKNSSQIHRVSAGKTVATLFRLVRQTAKPGRKPGRPPDVIDAAWVDPDRFGLMAFVEKELNWPWPPAPALGKWPAPDPVINPPPEEVVAALQALSDWIALNHPAAPVDPGAIRLHIDPAYSVDTIPAHPYAYLALGDGGAFLPVALTAADRTLPSALSIRKSGLSGIDHDLQEQLVATGIGRVDVLAAAWTDLLTTELGIPPTGATAVIQNAISKVDSKQDGSLQHSLLQLKGVDAQVAAILAAVGITTTTALANITAPLLLAQVGENRTIDLAFAERLVEEARRLGT